MGNTPTQNPRKSVNRWISVSLLDAGEIKSPRVINDASWATKHQ